MRTRRTSMALVCSAMMTAGIVGVGHAERAGNHAAVKRWAHLRVPVVLQREQALCGPSCIDRANLRVHCWLRVAQGWWSAAAADRIAAEAAPDRRCPNTACLESITRARLIGVYAHRPSSWPMVDHWIAEFAERERRTA